MDVNLERLDLIIRGVFRSQRAFASSIGVHETTVSYWLRGARSPSVENLQTMRAVGINVDYLLGNSSDPFTEDQAGVIAREKFNKFLGQRTGHGSGAGSGAGSLSGLGFGGGFGAGAGAEDGSDGSSPNLVPVGRGPITPARRTRLSPEIERIMVDAPTPAGQDVIIPMLESSIPAGDRVPIYEDLATQFNVTVYYRNCFTMRVKGDSMMDAGICDGDRVVIKRGHRFRDGDVIAAVVDGEMTLKGVWKKDGKIYLVPANPKYRIVEIAEESDFQCLGVCIDTFRPPKRVDWRQ